MEGLAVVDTQTGEVIDELGAEQQMRDAWERVKQSGKRMRDDWLAIATGLDVGRQLNTKDGKLYKQGFGRWVDAEGLGDMPRGDRGAALWLLDNWGALLNDDADAIRIEHINPEDVAVVFEKNNHPVHIRNELNKISKKRAKDAEIASQEEDIASSELPVIDREYHVISIDPPWPYEDGNDNSYDAEGRRVSNPYPEMSIDDIAGLQMPAADDSVLWLWTTHRFLPDAFGLLEEWGFDYKATMVWDKQNIGMGHWLRMQCEFCLLAIRGNPVWTNTTERDLLSVARREHSRKPDEFFDMVGEICTGAKLEYFSREKREGWDQIGNDKEKF